MPPIVSVVGNSDSGKTTVIEKLIIELRSRNYRVATIKNARDVTMDQPGTDSWRHVQAGSNATAVKSEDKMMLITSVAVDITLDEMAQYLGEDYDIIITEGFKHDSAPKIEVHRRDTGSPLTDIKKVIATVTDEPLATETRQFSFDDINSLADLLEEGFIKPQREPISLYINNAPIVLSSFPKRIIASTVTAMASSLKGVGEISNLKIFLRKKER